MHKHQQEYYQALNQSTAETDCAVFIRFMLSMIRDALENGTTPEVKKLLVALDGEVSSQQLMAAMGLKDEKHFRQPALAAGVIEMTNPDKPRSSRQRYRLTTLDKHW